MGKFLIIVGIVIIIVGVLIHYGSKIPFLGKLPGDITIKWKGFELHIPLMTGLLISILLSTALYLYYRIKG